eukprot:scaffold3240_cov187-Amphora_coffeaeformis.AAC.9
MDNITTTVTKHVSFDASKEWIVSLPDGWRRHGGSCVGVLVVLSDFVGCCGSLGQHSWRLFWSR